MTSRPFADIRGRIAAGSLPPWSWDGSLLRSNDGRTILIAASGPSADNKLLIARGPVDLQRLLAEIDDLIEVRDIGTVIATANRNNDAQLLGDALKRLDELVAIRA